ncbi:MAG: hypothetical protein BRD49_04750, partial [Bacteroidetes bacterium SW_10_40_5]
DYNVYVREICGLGDTSAWEGPLNFSTVCPNQFALPYNEDFENFYITDDATGMLCWSPNPSNTTSDYRWNPNQGLTPTSAFGAVNPTTGPNGDHTFPNGGGTYLYTEANDASSFGGDLSNKLTLGFTALRDFREIKGEPFPSVVIGNNREDATTILGVDPFSGKNAVDQNIFQLINNLKIYEGNHTITIGTSNRLFDFNNLFVDYFHGHYQFNNVEDFYNSAQNDTSTASSYQLKYSVDENE